jgi:hypothetical protein
MQTGKIRRSVAKLRQLRDDWYSYHGPALTLWLVNRTEETRNELPPGLRKTGLLPAIVALTPNGSNEYYILPNQQLPADFVGMLKRTDRLLADAGLVPDYAYDKTLHAVAKLAIQGRITKATQYCWQGGSAFAKPFVDTNQVPLACLDWFVKVDRLAEAVGDSIDELLISLETVSDEQQPTPVTIEQPAAKPSEPKRSRKKSAVPPEKSKQEIAFGFLLLWHQYGTEDFNNDPIPAKQDWQLWMKDRSPDKPVPSPTAVSHMMKMFGGQRKYNQHCQARTIERELAKAVLESAKVPQSKLPKERSTDDPEIDLE